MTIMVPQPTPSDRPPAERAALALSILNHRPATDANLELAVMALRGADITTLLAADQQMAAA
jgi:hypothetical protein